MFKFNPYTLRREKTMYLQTIQSVGERKTKSFFRESSFQKHDIEGTSPRRLIPKQIKTNYTLSSDIEPISCRAKNRSKLQNISFDEETKAKNKYFKTRRLVNPLNPQYSLPSCSSVSLDPGRKFIRNNLQTDDINMKKSHQTHSCERMKLPIQGSSPAKLIREVRAISRLDVSDITKSGMFRINNPASPLKLSKMEEKYDGVNHFSKQKKRPDLCLSIMDIQRAQSKPFFSKFYHIDKRRDFKTFMKVEEIESSSTSKNV